ncbi:MAG TPA: thioredoxin domain-containing protein [Thermoanaerobaculia bacterium]
MPFFLSVILTFKVIGIDCSACAKPVIKALSSVDGVKSAKLDWRAATARVDVPDDFDRSRIRKAMNNAGFEVAFPGEQVTAMMPLPTETLEKLDIVSYPGTSKLNFNQILAAGKITVVDFYADWCGPCHVLESRMQHFMVDKPNLAVRRVNIGKWDNEAARQATREFRAEALPYVRVYDAKGKFVAAVTGGMWDEVLAALEKAGLRS